MRRSHSCEVGSAIDVTARDPASEEYEVIAVDKAEQNEGQR